MYFGKVGYSRLGELLAKKKARKAAAAEEARREKERKLWELLKSLKPESEKETKCNQDT